jgi:hypothetical protein
MAYLMLTLWKTAVLGYKKSTKLTKIRAKIELGSKSGLPNNDIMAKIALKSTCLLEQIKRA